MSNRAVFHDTFSGVFLLPPFQYTVTAAASGAILPAAVTGSQENVLLSSGATALTTPTAANMYATLLAALAAQGSGPFANVPSTFSYRVRVINTNAGTLTLTAGTGVTITGLATIATNTWREYVVTPGGNNTCTFQSIGTGAVFSALAALPAFQYTVTAAASGTIAAAAVSGYMENVLLSSGATALTTETAAHIYAVVLAALGAVPTSFSFLLRVINSNAGTLTLTGGTGVTITGTAAIATNTWAEYIVTLTSGTVVGFQAIGTGVAP